MKKKPLLLILLLAMLAFCSCVDNDIVERFCDLCSEEKSFEEYCEGNDTYKLEVRIDNSRLLLHLKKDNDMWSGNLSHYDSDQALSLVEKIPVSVKGEELVIHSSLEKRVPLSSIMLHRNFDPDVCTIEWAAFDSFDYPLEEIRGNYPLHEIKPYMEKLYAELFSNLNTFCRKEEYFRSIEKLSSFVYIRDLMNQDLPGHHLSFGFCGDNNIQWYPGYGSFDKISLLMHERISSM